MILLISDLQQLQTCVKTLKEWNLLTGSIRCNGLFLIAYVNKQNKHGYIVGQRIFLLPRC